MIKNIKTNTIKFNLMSIRGKHGSTLVMIVLMFALLLVLGTGAGMMASISSRSAISETKREQAYIAARSLALAIKDEIVSQPNDELVNNLLGATELSSDYLAGTEYQLAVASEELGSITEHTFTVSATFEGATEQYSFKIHERTIYSPETAEVTDMFYADTWAGGNSFNATLTKDVTVLSDFLLKGDFTGERIRSGGNFEVKTGHVEVNGAIVALGTATISSTIKGTIYAQGNVYINDDVDGSIYTTGNVIVANGVKSISGSIHTTGTVTVKSGVIKAEPGIVPYADADSMPDAYKKEIKELEEAVYKINGDGEKVKMTFEDLPKPFTLDSGLLQDAIDSDRLTTTSDNIVITDHVRIGGDDFRGNNKKATIDATSSPDGIIYVYIESNMTRIDTEIKTIGHVVFVLKEGVRINFNNGSRLYSDIEKDGLNTYIYGMKNNYIEFKGADLHAFIYIEGNNGFLDFANPVTKLVGFAQAASINIQNTITEIVFYSPGDSGDDDGGTGYSKSYNFVGVSN